MRRWGGSPAEFVPGCCELKLDKLAVDEEEDTEEECIGGESGLGDCGRDLTRIRGLAMPAAGPKREDVLWD